MKRIKKMISAAKKLGWEVTEEIEYYEFRKISIAGQDFSFSIYDIADADDFINKIYEYYEDFDCSTETYLWLDSDGHGMHGAPSNMKDLYIDFESIEADIKKLYDYLYILGGDN